MSGAGDLVALRRALHALPELGFAEEKTQALVGQHLAAIGAPRPVAGTGWLVDLGPADARHTLLLRADMDGLPIAEATGLPYASTHAGRMHACGHDAHMAALVGAGRVLAEELPPGLRLRLLFQPAEEGAGGARAVMAEGALDGVDAAFGLHVWNELPVGTVAVTPGGIMAGVVELNLRVRGRGGHGALPHRTRDPIVAAAQLVLALQTVVSRGESPLDAAVVSLGAIHAGDAFNVIPDEAVLRGTVRAMTLEQEARLETAVRQVAGGVGRAAGVEIEVSWERYAVPTVNNPEFAELVGRAARRVVGIEHVRTDYRTMAGEDFGDILARVPGAFVLLGSGPADGSAAEPHHSPRFEIDEAVLPIASALHVEVVREVARSL